MNIGDRIKKYERASRLSLLPRSYVVIRVDGKAFHTFTRGCEKPFDRKLINAMVRAGERCAAEMQGFKIGYHQSDEFTFILSDLDSYESEMWFDREVQKLVSVTASMFGAYFNDEMGGTTAVFDARAFNVPAEDVPNTLIWRQRDWERNSIQMLARAHFSAKELHNKKHADIHEMLHQKAVNWAKLDDDLKNGTLITKRGERITAKFDYDFLNALLDRLTGDEEGYPQQ